MADTLVFQAGPLTRAIEAIVAAGGSEPREAKLVADNLVTANLTGHDSHGVGMMPRYIDALLEGGLEANRHPAATLDAGALLALDGRKGYGQAIGLEAMRMAIERAKQHGCCVMALGNTHHLGRIGHWAELAVQEGLVSIHFVNVISHARVAPYAGRDARFGTNPCCIGVPLPGGPPFILDYATRRVAPRHRSRLRARSAAVPRMVAPGPARARIRQGAHRRRSRARDAAQARKGWHSGGPEHLGGNSGRRGQAQARTRDRAAARRRPMTRRDATLGWIRVWGRAARLALAVAVAGLSPASYTPHTRTVALQQIYFTAWQVLIRFTLFAALLGLVVVQITVSVARDLDLGAYALGLVLRVL